MVIARQRNSKHISTEIDTDIIEVVVFSVASNRQQCSKHVSTVTINTQQEELLEAVLSIQSAPRLYNKDQEQVVSCK